MTIVGNTMRLSVMIHRFLRASLLLLAALFSAPAISQQVVTYFHTDGVASPVAATDTYGNTVWTEDYAPYGERWTVDINGQPNRQWFTGHTEDKETGLINAGVRFYDAATGRFLSTDPASLDPNDPSTFNRYAYGKNNPYRYVDPDGRVPVDTVWDLLSVIYDLGKAGFGKITGNADLVNEGMTDAALDTVAMGVPYLPAGASKVARWGKTAADKAAEKGAASSRVKLRKNTREQIGENQPRNSSGEMVDPHSGEPLRPGEIDVGHKPGQEWRKRKQMHEDAGSTRRQVIETENDPRLYHLEDRSSNRSHRHEQK